jgi:hypothetical protein
MYALNMYCYITNYTYTDVFYLPLTLIFMYPTLSEYTTELPPNIHNARTFARTLVYYDYNNFICLNFLV